PAQNCRLRSSRSPRSPHSATSTLSLHDALPICQVHAATLADGTRVVVKVQRPGVVEQIDQDLQILRNLAATASRRWPVAEEYDVDRKSTRLNSSHVSISYAVFCLKKKRFARIGD